MKTRRVVILLSVFALCTANICGAQSVNDVHTIWSLEKCIAYAKENNLQVKQTALQIESAKNSLLGAKLALVPSVSASMSHSMNWGRSVNLQTLEIIHNKLSQSTSASLGASVTVFDGLANVNTLRSSRAQLKISEQQVEKLKNDITIEITKAYLQVLLAEEILNAAEVSCNSMALQVDRTSKLVDEGSQAYSTLLEIKAQYAQEQVNLVSAKNDVRTNRLTLTQLLDLPDSDAERFSVAAPDTSSVSMAALKVTVPSETIGAIYDMALVLPQIKSAEYSLEKSKYDYRTARGRLYPSISLSAGYGSYHTGGDGGGAFFPQLDKNKNYSLSFSMSIPIFAGLQYRLSARNSKVAMESSRIDFEIQKHNLYKEVQTAYNEAFSALERLKAAEENLRSISESFTYTENKFNVGMMTGTDYNIAKANLFKTKSSFIQSKYQYLFDLKIIDFYKGKPVTL